MTKIVVISDTHGKHDQIIMPEGDILVHCGDCTNYGTLDQTIEFMNWFEKQAYQYKIFIAGNHDFLFEKDPAFITSEIVNRNFIYLEDSSILISIWDEETRKVRAIKFYGSPYQPEFCNWAFNVERGPKLAAIWDKIPNDVDFLITHGPPKGILDRTPSGENVGCDDLLKRVKEIQPKYHAFGHIHHSYGTYFKSDWNIDPTLFINASICTESYQPTNKPIVLDY